MTQTFQVAAGDWVLGLGRPLLISDTAKLRQDIRETLTVSRQPNGFGAGLDDRIGQDVDPSQFRMLISQDISRALTALQSLQTRFLRTKRSTAERLGSVRRLNVREVNGEAPMVPLETFVGTTSPAKTSYYFQLDVLSVAGQSAGFSGSVTG